MERTVFITGAAGGLGKALSEEFARRGWLVFAADTALFPSSQPSIYPVQMDVTDDASIERAITVISKETSHIDLLINNAGLFDAYPLSEISFEELYRIYAVNTFGAFRVIRQSVPLLLPSKGRIVSISSESVKFPSLFQPYQASKIAMEAIHRTISQELYLKGIRMSLIRSGAIRTHMTEQVEHLNNPVKDTMFKKEFTRFAFMANGFRGRLLCPEKVARTIYRRITARHLRQVYRINNNTVLTLLAMIPEQWMKRLLKWKLSN